MNFREQRKRKSQHFDRRADIYEEVRPDYPIALFERIKDFVPIQENLNFLEIGAGNGIASELIYSIWNPKFSLIEPGAELFEFLEDLFGQEQDVDLHQDFFEKLDFPENHFDAIFCATAFHWLERKKKYRRTHEMLKEDGYLILFWNHYLVDSPQLADKLQDVYLKYGYIKEKFNIYDKQRATIDYLKKEADNHWFELVAHEEYARVEEYSPEKYVKLLQTFASQAKYAPEFYDEIIEAIQSENENLSLRVLTNLEIAKKRI